MNPVQKTVYLILVTAIFVYLLLRAVYVPLVFDEAFTFLYYIHSEDYLPYLSHGDANNHFLNSALAHLSWLCLGKSEFAIRLPNVLSFILFAFYAWKLTQNIRYRWLGLFTAIALLTANFSLEFFGMCRGYGMSMALLLAALYQFSVFIRKNITVRLLFSLLFMMLAVSANLSLLVSFLIMIGIAFIWLNWKWRKEKNIKKYFLQMVILLLTGIIPCFFEAAYAFHLQETGALYYGSLDGFISVTLKPLLKLQVGTGHFSIEVMVILFFALMLITGFLHFLKNGLSDFSLVLLFLLGNVVAVILMAHLLGIHYPRDRAGLYFIPLFILCLGYTVDIWMKKKKILILVGLPLLFFPVHFLFQANLSYFNIWPGESALTRFHQKIMQLEKEQNKKFTISGITHTIWAYLGLDVEHAPQPIQITDFPDNTQTDFIIARRDQLSFFKKDYRAVDTDERHSLFLLERKQKLAAQLKYILKKPAVQNTSDEFVNIYMAQDTVPQKTMLLQIEADIQSDEIPLRTLLVFSAMDAEGNNLFYEALELGWLKTHWNNHHFLLTRCQIPLPPATTRYLVYFWNPERQKFSVKNVSVKVYRLVDHEPGVGLTNNPKEVAHQTGI